MSLSISVSAPVMTRFTCLSCSREIWRTMRASLSNDLPERHHAHLEDAALHLREVPIEARDAGAASSMRELAQLARRARTRSREARDRAAHDRELADDVHQVIELADVDAHRLAHRSQRELAPAGAARAGGRWRRASCGAADGAGVRRPRRRDVGQVDVPSARRRARRSAHGRLRRERSDARRIGGGGAPRASSSVALRRAPPR